MKKWLWILALVAVVLVAPVWSQTKVLSWDKSIIQIKVGTPILVEMPEGASLVGDYPGWRVEREQNFLLLTATKEILTTFPLNLNGKTAKLVLQGTNSQVEDLSKIVIGVEDFENSTPRETQVEKREVKTQEAPKLISPKEQKMELDGLISLNGGNSKLEKSKLFIEGQAIIAGKTTSGMIFQGSAKVDSNSGWQQYGFSAGIGFEPKSFGVFLFADGLLFRLDETSTTAHMQIRPTIRVKTGRFNTSAFYAYPLLAEKPNGRTTLVEGIQYDITNRAIWHAGINAEALVMPKVLAKVKAIFAEGGAYKIAADLRLSILKGLFVGLGVEHSDYGNFPLLLAQGFSKATQFGLKIGLDLGKSAGISDLRDRIYVEPDYPLVVSDKKKQEGQDGLRVSLTANPTRGKAPLAVDFEATIYGGKSPYKLKWNYALGNPKENPDQRTKYAFSEKGVYTCNVEVTDRDGLKATSNNVTIEVLADDAATYVITATAGPNGAITPSGAITVQAGGTQSFAMTPASGYRVEKVMIDDVNDMGSLTSYTFENVRANRKIHVTFVPVGTEKYYSITATSGAGGSISPSGTVQVLEGTDRSFSITASSGYQIARVVVDGVDVGKNGIYQFTKISANHTIHAEFSASGYDIVAGGCSGVTISPSGTIRVPTGQNLTFTITKQDGYVYQNLLVDGVAVGTPSSYTFTNVVAPHTIQVVCGGMSTYTITESHNAGGSVNPSGSVTVTHGQNTTFCATPQSCYYVQNVLVDGVSVGAVDCYTFTNITANHTIQFVFALKNFVITATAGVGGSISPSGSVMVACGTSPSFTIYAATGYEIDQIIYNGVPQPKNPVFNLPPVVADGTLNVSFRRLQYTIVASAGPNGSISPSGSVLVNHGDSQTFNFTPNAGYQIDTITVDGANVTPGTSYTFNNVTANHSVSVTFRVLTYTVSVRWEPFEGGSLSHNGNYTVNHGSNISINATANAGYELENWTVNGQVRNPDNPLLLTNIQSNMDVTARFRSTGPTQFTINASAGAGGTITPSGSVVVAKGGSQGFTMTPNTGYEVDYVLVDGANVGALTYYQFTNVQANHTIAAYFKKQVFSVSAYAYVENSCIEISPLFGATPYEYGTVLNFTIRTLSPTCGKRSIRVTINGTLIETIDTDYGIGPRTVTYTVYGPMNIEFVQE